MKRSKHFTGLIESDDEATSSYNNDLETSINITIQKCRHRKF